MKKLIIATMLLVTASHVPAQQKYPWQNPDLPTAERVENLISMLTPEEKVGLMMNKSISVDRLGIPSYNWWSEACHGVRQGGYTVFPQPIGMAAAFSEKLIYDVFSAVSDEARANWNRSDHNIFNVPMGVVYYPGNPELSFWCPNVNIFRDPRWGRGQETCGEDPYMNAVLGVQTVLGMQQPQKTSNLQSPLELCSLATGGTQETSNLKPQTSNLQPPTSQKEVPAIGFHITGAFDKILPIEKCWLMDDLHNRIRNEIRDYALEHGLSFFDLRQQVGLLRDVIIRNSASGEWMVIIQFHYDETGGEKEALALLQHIADKFQEITSLLYLDNQKCNDTIGDQEILVFKGNDHIYELMEDLKFKVGPKSFYQTNTEQAYHLYSVVRDFAFSNLQPPTSNLKPQTSNLKPQIYDLYTGTGTIANFVARKARQVIGIEYVPEAIEDAKVNSEINGIDNTLFYAGDMKDILTDAFIEEHGRPDVIITDPPRAGMHPDVVKTILRAAPQRIVYVSCNPATQARDLHDMDADYRVVAVQPVDMFPHTPHVENVVLLERR